MLDVLKALQHVDIAVREEVFHTCRALLVHRREDLGMFDRAFEVFWSRRDAVQQPSASMISATLARRSGRRVPWKCLEMLR